MLSIRRKGNSIYNSWKAMMNRCYNKSNANFDAYGGSGILVEKRWHLFESFHQDMSDSFSKGLTLERKNNSKGYSRKNCVWASRRQQSVNRRSTNWLFDESTGGKLCLTDFAKKFGLSRNTVTSRIRIGMTSFKELSAPSIGRGRKVRSRCYRGHRLVAGNLYYWKSGGRTERACKECTLLRSAIRYKESRKIID